MRHPPLDQEPQLLAASSFASDSTGCPTCDRFHPDISRPVEHAKTPDQAAALPVLQLTPSGPRLIVYPIESILTTPIQATASLPQPPRLAVQCGSRSCFALLPHVVPCSVMLSSCWRMQHTAPPGPSELPCLPDLYIITLLYRSRITPQHTPSSSHLLHTLRTRSAHLPLASPHTISLPPSLGILVA